MSLRICRRGPDKGDPNGLLPIGIEYQNRNLQGVVSHFLGMDAHRIPHLEPAAPADLLAYGDSQGVGRETEVPGLGGLAVDPKTSAIGKQSGARSGGFSVHVNNAFPIMGNSIIPYFGESVKNRLYIRV